MTATLPSSRLRSMLLQFEPSDVAAMYLVRSVEDAHRAAVRPSSCKKEVLANPCTAMRLDRAIEHVLQHVWSDDLDHRDLALRRLVTLGVHLFGSGHRKQARLIDLDARIRDPFHDDALLGKALAEWFAAARALTHRFQRSLG